MIAQGTSTMPPWNKNNYDSFDSRMFQKNIEFLNSDQTAEISTIAGVPSGTNKYSSGTIAPNGKIYCTPFNADHVLVINTNDDTISTITSGIPNGNGKWHGGCLAPNGKIYCAPYARRDVLEIDPESDTVTSFGNLPAGNQIYTGIAAAPNGTLYASPLSASGFLKVNPTNKTITTFGTTIANDNYYGAVCAPNGRIYFIPNRSSEVIEVNPENDNITRFGTLTPVAGDNHFGASMGIDGNIYSTALNVTQIIKINTENNTVSYIAAPSGTLKYRGATIALNGKTLGAPWWRRDFLEIDTGAETATVGLNLNPPYTGINNTCDAVLAPNGKIYLVPFDLDFVGVVYSEKITDRDIYLSRHINNY